MQRNCQKHNRALSHSLTCTVGSIRQQNHIRRRMPRNDDNTMGCGTTGNGWKWLHIALSETLKLTNGADFSAPSVFICYGDSNILNLLFFQGDNRDYYIYELHSIDCLPQRVLHSYFHCNYGLYSKCTSARRLFLNYHI